MNVNNGATISPGSGGAALGSLNVGSLTLSPTGKARFQLKESEPVVKNDLLTVAGSASIQGELIVQMLNSNVLPAANQTYTLLTATTLSGAFANIANGGRIDTVEGLGSFIVNYGVGSPFDPNHVVLSGFQRNFTADFDDDGDVDGDDLAQWRGDFGENAFSDADGDGDSDGADFLAWQRQLGSKPAVVMATSVPEPAGALLSLLSAGGTAGYRRRQRLFAQWGYRMAASAAGEQDNRVERFRVA